MTRWALAAPLLLLLGLSIHSAAGQEAEDSTAPPPPPPGSSSESAQQDEEDQEWGMNSLRGGFEAVGGYFDSVLEYMGGRDGVCQHRCRYGKTLKRTRGITHPGFRSNCKRIDQLGLSMTRTDMSVVHFI